MTLTVVASAEIIVMTDEFKHWTTRGCPDRLAVLGHAKREGLTPYLESDGWRVSEGVREEMMKCHREG